MASTLEHEWQLDLPASTPEQLLAALAARDRIFGETITFEPEDDPKAAVEAWFGTTETLEGNAYRMAVYAELKGPEEYLEAVCEALDDTLAEHVEAGALDAQDARLLETRPAASITLVKPKEKDERPELIVPEWLAPGELELPWSYRPADREGAWWPSDAQLEAHKRLAVVPAGDELRLYSLPEISDEE
jgi:hypothetical protein